MGCHRHLRRSHWKQQWRRYLLAVADVAGHEQDLGGRESGGDGQTVLLLADLLSVGVDPLLHMKEHNLSASNVLVAVKAFFDVERIVW